MSPVELSALFFGVMILCLAAGAPIAIVLGGLSAILVTIFWGPKALSMVVLKAYGNTSSFEFLAIPLFVFMANMLERSGIAEDLYRTMYRFVGHRRGGLAAGTILICTIFAAMAGISGAATVSMGILALPAMLSRGYSKRIALGSVAAGGSLGILIPPSVTMIVYGLVSQTSVGRLYAGGVLPGLLLAAMFIAYVLIRSHLQPSLAPPAPPEERFSWREKLRSLTGLVFPLLLVVAVLGSILTGFTSISEAAAVGAFGALVATALKGRLGWAMLRQAADNTLLVSCLIFWIIIGASAFSTLYTAMGAASLVKDLVLGLGADRYLVLVGMQIVLILLGMVIDTVGIIMITVPVFLPIIVALGFDPVWFGVLFIINMEIGFLTPPFGYNLFYLKGVAPPGVTIGDIYGSIVPFVVLMMAALGLCIVFPEIILWLPRQIF
ncbi:MAG: TRAP transporter large permease subunit [Ectothiorhodospiraceae bacterium]|nr:TRAP transporter large permease subunit [Ectothiorhodospiraceae bacterium]